jgi:tRNA(Ile)-lysidine synthase
MPYMSSLLIKLAVSVESLRMAGTRIVVGVSGGADSVALLRGLHSLPAASRLELVAAHLNHGLRPGQAEGDAEWTRELCHRLNVPVVVEQADVPGRARGMGWNVEEAARIVRYEFLERTARNVDATHVAVAHHAGDQVETVLHHLFRGTGLAGLRGMRRSRPLAEGITLVRPLLFVHRVEIENWLAAIGQDFRTDATNADVSRTRNRIRHNVLPGLESEFGTQVRQTVLRLAEQADELQSTIEAQADRLLAESLADDSTEICRIDCRPLEGHPRHLVREVFVALWRRKNWPRQHMGFAEWDRLYQLTEGGAKIVLPGNLEATRRGTLLVIRQLGSAP